MSSRKKDMEMIMESLQTIKRQMIAHGLKKSAKTRKKMEEWITPSQWAVMSIVSKNENIGIKEVSKLLNITSSATTQLVNGLVSAGYVLREGSKNDRRALTLKLSETWKKRAQEMKTKSMARWTILLKALNDEEIAQYRALNKKIADQISGI